tara:strand:- start:789 stop:1322 length:534 start_codon:yes stop_codon:yes gene_type:complete
MAETPIVSSALQTTFRNNFPSQVSSGRDLHVSDVVVPIVDFSTTAGVTGLSVDLQQALAFANATEFDVNNTTTTLANSAGFWRISGGVSVQGQNPGNPTAEINISDGATDKLLLKYRIPTNSSGNTFVMAPFDLIVFLRSGDSVKATCDARTQIAGSYRQLADISGVLVNPTGYTGE